MLCGFHCRCLLNSVHKLQGLVDHIELCVMSDTHFIIHCLPQGLAVIADLFHECKLGMYEHQHF